MIVVLIQHNTTNATVEDITRLQSVEYAFPTHFCKHNMHVETYNINNYVLEIEESSSLVLEMSRGQ